MPPWLDWLDWLKWDSIGAGVIGKIVVLWFCASITVVKQVLKLLIRNRRSDRTIRTNVIDQSTLGTGHTRSSRTKAI